jgi:hypothetical protein
LDSATDAAGSDQSVDRGESVDDIIIASETVNRRLPARAAERDLDEAFAICTVQAFSMPPNYPDGVSCLASVSACAIRSSYAQFNIEHTFVVS